MYRDVNSYPPGVTVGRVEVVDRAGQLLGAVAIILAGVGWSISWALIASTFNWYGFMGDCGAPAVDAFSTSHDLLAQHCQHIGQVHLAIGIVLGGLIALGGLLVLLDAMAPNHRAGTPPSRRSLLVSALCGFALVFLAVTIAGTGAHASGSHTPTQALENDSGFGPPSVPG